MKVWLNWPSGIEEVVILKQIVDNGRLTLTDLISSL